MPLDKCGMITEKLQNFQAAVLNVMSNLLYYFSVKNGEKKSKHFIWTLPKVALNFPYTYV